MPTPQATVICLSSRQQQILEQITRQTTTPYRLVRRAQLILGAAQGKRNTELSAHLTLSRNQVQFWRDRWQQACELLIDVERTDISDLELRYRIEGILSDEPRAGTGAKFSVEQIVQIVALACELPASSGCPSSHWSPGELAEEAVKRGIVESISPRTVGRFLKRGGTATASSPLLAEC
jgi:putative transposase